jgi:hypothetical protein
MLIPLKMDAYQLRLLLQQERAGYCSVSGENYKNVYPIQKKDRYGCEQKQSAASG